MTSKWGELRKIIVKHTSEMLDNPDEYGIYPTSKFYDNLEQAIKKDIAEILGEAEQRKRAKEKGYL